MKQIIIAGNQAYAADSVKYTDLSSVGDGVLGLFNLADGKRIATDADMTDNFAVVCGRGTGKMPIHFPEVDVKTLTVTKATYQAGAKFSAKITIPTPVVGKDYTVIVSKIGTVFNERSNWSFMSRAKNTIAANVAKEISDNINANKENLGVTASYSSGVITITGTEFGQNYNVLGADSLMGVKPTDVVTAKLPILDKAYVQDLASRCAAGKGFNDVYADGDSIYPGYPEPVAANSYTMYTLRFAVPRMSAKQRDEVVYQTLHICVPTGAGAITTLDGIFFPSND